MYTYIRVRVHMESILWIIVPVSDSLSQTLTLSLTRMAVVAVILVTERLLVTRMMATTAILVWTHAYGLG